MAITKTLFRTLSSFTIIWFQAFSHEIDTKNLSFAPNPAKRSLKFGDLGAINKNRSNNKNPRFRNRGLWFNPSVDLKKMGKTTSLLRNIEAFRCKNMKIWKAVFCARDSNLSKVYPSSPLRGRREEQFRESSKRDFRDQGNKKDGGANQANLVLKPSENSTKTKTRCDYSSYKPIYAIYFQNKLNYISYAYNMNLLDDETYKTALCSKEKFHKHNVDYEQMLVEQQDFEQLATENVVSEQCSNEPNLWALRMHWKLGCWPMTLEMILRNEAIIRILWFWNLHRKDCYWFALVMENSIYTYLYNVHQFRMQDERMNETGKIEQARKHVHSMKKPAFHMVIVRPKNIIYWNFPVNGDDVKTTLCSLTNFIQIDCLDMSLSLGPNEDAIELSEVPSSKDEKLKVCKATLVESKPPTMESFEINYNCRYTTSSKLEVMRFGGFVYADDATTFNLKRKNMNIIILRISLPCLFYDKVCNCCVLVIKNIICPHEHTDFEQAYFEQCSFEPNDTTANEQIASKQVDFKQLSFEPNDPIVDKQISFEQIYVEQLSLEPKPTLIEENSGSGNELFEQSAGLNNSGQFDPKSTMVEEAQSISSCLYNSSMKINLNYMTYWPLHANTLKVKLNAAGPQ